MTPKQLPLAPPSPPRRTTDTYRAITVTAKDEETYFVYRVTPKDERTARNRAHRALGLYTGRFLHTPREIMCHAKNAAEIGSEVMGVQVLVLPSCLPDEFHIGPREA